MYRIRSEIESLEGSVSENIKHLPDIAVDKIARRLDVEKLDKKRKDTAKQLLREVPVYFKSYKGTGLSLLSVIYELLASMINGTHMPTGFVATEEPDYIKCEFILAPTRINMEIQFNRPELLRAQAITESKKIKFIKALQMISLHLGKNIEFYGSGDTEYETEYELAISNKIDNLPVGAYTFRQIYIKKSYLTNLDKVRLDHARLNDFFKEKAASYDV